MLPGAVKPMQAKFILSEARRCPCQGRRTVVARAGRPVLVPVLLVACAACAAAQATEQRLPATLPSRPAGTLESERTQSGRQPQGAVTGGSMRLAETAAGPATSPANLPPHAAKVSWEKEQLTVSATNSSLRETVREVAARTGAELTWSVAPPHSMDQRLFGTYGPGTGCAVLSQLLDGSGYNVILLGSSATGAPLKIVVTRRLPAMPREALSEERLPEPAEPVPQPEVAGEGTQGAPEQNPFALGEHPPDPVVYMQEILERQQRIDQQQGAKASTSPP